jgi:lipopolysaccharide export system protein LptC
MTVAHHSMDMWGPRRATSLKEARGRTALVHILRLLFTIGAVMSAGILIGFLVKHGLEQGQAKPAPPPTGVTVLGPQFRGRDANDQPYTITAETARRRRDNSAIVDLTNPHLENADSKTVSAREGVWDEKSRILDLVGNVVMQDAAGYTFTTESARMYVEENRVEGPVPIKGVGPIGEISADSYEVLDDGNHIILRGNTTTTFTPKKRDGAGKQR